MLVVENGGESFSPRSRGVVVGSAHSGGAGIGDVQGRKSETRHPEMRAEEASYIGTASHP